MNERPPTGGGLRSPPRDTMEVVRDVARDVKSLDDRIKARLDAGAEAFAQLRALAAGADATAKAAHVAVSIAERDLAALNETVRDLKPAKVQRPPVTLHVLWVLGIASTVGGWVVAADRFIGRAEVERAVGGVEARAAQCEKEGRELELQLARLGTRFDEHVRAEAAKAAAPTAAPRKGR